MEFDNTPTPLCNLGYKYGTDKCPQIKHAYTPFYYHLLKSKRETLKKVLELGIGKKRRNAHIPEIVYEQGIKRYLERGGSLYMWQDFFPNAQIYGADNNPATIFSDDRITTYLVDERKTQDLQKLIDHTGRDIDVVIDDASHRVDDQIFSAQTLLPLLQDDVVYIIEDVSHSKLIMRALGDQYNGHVPSIYRKWKGGMILVITKKALTK
jgi:hypothetical protein